MAKRFKHPRRMEELLAIEQDIAATEGRCQGRMSIEQYRAAKATETSEYRDPGQCLSYWAKVEVAILESQAETTKSATIYEMAQAEVWRHRDSFSDETITIWSKANFRVSLRRHQGRIILSAGNGDPRQVERIACGFFIPAGGGWTWSLGKDEYDRWVRQIKRQLVK